jgi:hypothetical protein
MADTLYRQHLGAQFDRLPAAVRAFHSLQGAIEFDGSVSILGAQTAIGRFLAAVMRLPAAAPDQPFRFRLDANPRSETWTRLFPTKVMRSRLSIAGAYLTERLGPARLWFKLEAQETQLSMHLCRVTVFGIPVPGFLLPTVQAVEQGADGVFYFDIDASWSPGKRVVAYRGALVLSNPESRDGRGL